MTRASKVLAASVVALFTLSALAAAPVAYHGKFVEVAPTEIQPGGWLKEMLNRQAVGLARNHAVSGYPYDSCLWTGIIPKGGTSESWKPWWPYEQTGYLVDGLERLGIVSGNADVRAEAEANVHYILAHPAADGSLGPTHIGATNWPQAVVFRALIASYNAAPDPAIPEALRKHYLARPADYGKARDVCNVETILWTYAHTGDPALLTLAQHTYDNFNAAKPASGLAALSSDKKIVEHGVTFNETAKLPAILYMYNGDKSLLDATSNAYNKIDRDHMTASGMHTAEEKLDGKDPWRYTETCDVTDYTWSVGYLLMASGDATWADHIEKAVFNAGMGAITKDFKSHQYFSAANQVIVTPGICKKYFPDRLAYRPGHDVECCTGNVERFLPNFALRQWMRTPDGGVVAALYSPGNFTTKIGNSTVSIDEQTAYPFEETVTFIVHTDKAATFPLLLRIPGWTANATLTINGKPFDAPTSPGTFVTLNRTFADGDKIELHLPMPVKINQDETGCMSIERGPLVYSLQIAPRATPITGTKATAEFPAWDIRPASPWNYALDLSSKDAAKVIVTASPPAYTLDLISKDGSKSTIISVPSSAIPWDPAHSPVTLTVPGRKITNWGLSAEGGNPGFPKVPEFSPTSETLTLVPFGQTCLRLTVFPAGQVGGN